ncbi:MAG: flagellar basal-body MS-ring/collar protein FliF [Gammaproteobacteria bacterium]|nr:flagellar basal body M-ring protein FliF [Gammaproteobacteria bacterium]
MSAEATTVPSTDAPTLPAPAWLSSALKPIAMLVGIAAAVAVGVGVVLWSREPTYALLYGNLSTSDAAQIAQALDEIGVPYKVDTTTGAITVPADRVHDARLKLAAQGLPETDGGFALIAKEPGFGVSQFMEGARYQHALETELARTIANLQAVEAARVHLALPRQSPFVRDRRTPSASVFLRLKPGRRLESEQVTAIANLVASSIPELASEHVTIVDQQGRLLSAPGTGDELAAREKQLEIARSIEERYASRIESLLAPLVGVGRVRAQVVADVELSTTEEAREQYRPESQVVRSEQIAEETSRNGTGPLGVPGALTNQPPVGGVALPPGVDAAAASQVDGNAENGIRPPDNVSRQATRNYEIDRTIAYTKQPAGRLKRLTVAVLIDNLRTTDEEGNVVETPLTQEEIDNITRLVKDAVGFDASRGDSVNVVNASFRGEVQAQDVAVDEIPLWQHPLARDIAKLIAALIVLIVLVVGVLRPIIRSLLGPPRDQPALPPPAEQEVVATVTDEEPQRPAALDYEGQLEHARALVSQDPARVAQVVKSWVGDDD